MLREALVDKALQKYGLPKWMKPYILNYLKGNSANAIKRAISFINVGRKKGIITKREIMLPNGTTFEKQQILRLVSLFLYGEERLSEISRDWATSGADSNPQHAKHFAAMAAVEAKRARAIKNMIQGLGRMMEPTDEIIQLYDYIGDLGNWNERIVTKKIILDNSFARPFGYVFYKVFYPVSPEFMRSFGKAFSRGEEELMGEEEASNVVRDKTISEQRLMQLTESVLSMIARCVDAEMRDAKKAKVEREAALLRDIAIAFPLHRLRELGVDLDIDTEMSVIKRMAKNGNYSAKNKRNN